MHQRVSDDYHLVSDSAYPITFENEEGHKIRIFIIDNHVIRVLHTINDIDENVYQQSLKKQQSTTNAATDYTFTQQLHFNSTGAIKKTVFLTTKDIQLSVTCSPFAISWYKAPVPTSDTCVTNVRQRPQDDETDEGDWFAQDLAYRSYSYDAGHRSRWHYQRQRTNSEMKTLYYGLGERSGRLNLGGRRFRLERMDAMGYDAETQDPLYKFCPFYVGIIPSSTPQVYGVYYNNFGETTMDFGQEKDAMWGDYTYYQTGNGPLDYYVIYGGSSVSKVVTTFNKMMGGQSLMPRYMLGYLASGMGYAERDNAQQELEQFVVNCREKYDIPCDGMHLSSGYTTDPGLNTDSAGDRWVFNWNKQRFPNPKKLAKTYRDAGMKIFANVKPWLLTTHPDYSNMVDEKGLMYRGDGQPATIWQWRGGAHTKGKASYIDFSSQPGYDYWKSKITDHLLDFGFDIWLDNNEFTMMDNEDLKFKGDLNCDDYPTLSPSSTRIAIPPISTDFISGYYINHSAAQTLLMIQATYEAVKEHLHDERSCLITRSTVPFCQSIVAQTWSGDNYTTWKTIAYNVAMGTGAGLCAMPGGYGHDTCGFAGPAPDAEQMVRWVQQGVFWTRFCIHSFNSDKSITEPWMYPTILSTVKSAIQWRYKWMPHLYSLYVNLSYRNNEPVVRPTLYDHPHDRRTYNQDFDFMVGSQLLVAPVCKQGATNRVVYLPTFYQADTKGKWYHYQTGQIYPGGQDVAVPTFLDDPLAPFFIKEGTFMCYGKCMPHTNALPDDERRIQIYPPPADDAAVAYENRKDSNEKPYRWKFMLTEDDGHTTGHQQNNNYTDVELWMECYTDKLLVGIDILHDGYFPEYDTLWVTCPLASEKRPLVFDGQGEDDTETTNFGNDYGNDGYIYHGFKVNWKASNKS